MIVLKPEESLKNSGIQLLRLPGKSYWVKSCSTELNIKQKYVLICCNLKKNVTEIFVKNYFTIFLKFLLCLHRGCTIWIKMCDYISMYKQ